MAHGNRSAQVLEPAGVALAAYTKREHSSKNRKKEHHMGEVHKRLEQQIRAWAAAQKALGVVVVQRKAQ